MTRACALAIVAACWTGPDAPPSAPTAPRPQAPPVDLQVSLERTACFGACPTYNLSIYGDGSVHWHGIANVREVGERKAVISRDRVDALAAAIDRARFFELDESGAIASDEPACVQNGAHTTCSFSSHVHMCSDTSHAIVVVRRGGRVHRVDDDHCEASPVLRIEELIDRVGGAERWR